MNSQSGRPQQRQTATKRAAVIAHLKRHGWRILETVVATEAAHLLHALGL